MLLKVIEDGIETPFEIDTAVDKNERWIMLWEKNKCVARVSSVDEAVQIIDDKLSIEK